jgi:hypothetical protein
MAIIQKIKPIQIFVKVKYFTIIIAFAMLLLLSAFILSILYVSSYYYQIAEQRNTAEDKAKSDEASFENFVPPTKIYLTVSYSCVALVFVLTTFAFITYSKIFRNTLSLPFMIIFILFTLAVGCVILNTMYWLMYPNICPSNYTLSDDQCIISNFTPNSDDDDDTSNDTYYVMEKKIFGDSAKTLIKFYNLDNFVCFENAYNPTYPDPKPRILGLNSYTTYSGGSQGFISITSDNNFIVYPLPITDGHDTNPLFPLCQTLDDYSKDFVLDHALTFVYGADNSIVEGGGQCGLENDVDQYSFFHTPCEDLTFNAIYPPNDYPDPNPYPQNQSASVPYKLSSV